MFAKPRAQGPGLTNHSGFQFMAEWSNKDKAGYSYMAIYPGFVLGSLTKSVLVLSLDTNDQVWIYGPAKRQQMSRYMAVDSDIKWQINSTRLGD